MKKYLIPLFFLITFPVNAATYEGIYPKDLANSVGSVTTPAEGFKPSEVNDSIREIKIVEVGDHKITTVTGTYTVNGTDSVILGSSTSTYNITIGSATTVGTDTIGKWQYYKNISTGTMTISGTVANHLNQLAGTTTLSQGQVLFLLADKNHWHKMNADTFATVSITDGTATNFNAANLTSNNATTTHFLATDGTITTFFATTGRMAGNLTVSGVTGIVDGDIPDTITLTNITQIGTRQFGDMQGALGLGTQTIGNLALGTQTNGLLSFGTQTNGLLALGTQTNGLIAFGTQTNGLLGLATQTAGNYISQWFNNDLTGYGQLNFGASVDLLIARSFDSANKIGTVTFGLSGAASSKSNIKSGIDYVVLNPSDIQFGTQSFNVAASGTTEAVITLKNINLGTQTNGLLSVGTQTNGLLALGTQTNGLLSLGTQTNGSISLYTQTNGLLALGTQTNGNLEWSRLLSIPNIIGTWSALGISGTGTLYLAANINAATSSATYDANGKGTWTVGLGVTGNDPYTKLLLHFDGGSATTAFVDSSENEFAVTPNGGARMSNSNIKFGEACFQLNTGYVSTADTSELEFGNKNFFIDAWVYRNTNINPLTYIMSKYVDASNYVDFQYNHSLEALRFLVNSGGTLIINATSGSVTFGLDALHHVAVSRAGDKYRFFFDGNQAGVGTTNSTAVVDNAGSIGIGGNADNTLNNVFIDEFRLSIGASRHTGTFTSPVNAYGSSSPLYTY